MNRLYQTNLKTSVNIAKMDNSLLSARNTCLMAQKVPLDIIRGYISQMVAEFIGCT